MAISKKKLRAISFVSPMGKLLERFRPMDRSIAESHWSNATPDMWSKDESALFDLLCEHENAIKDEIIKILES